MMPGLDIGTRLHLFLLILALGALPGTLQAQPEGGVQLGQAEVEQRLSELQESIAVLQRKLDQSRVDHKKEQQQLRELDLAVQETARQLRVLKEAERLHIEELQKLEQQRDRQVADLRTRQGQLADQVAATYLLASQSRVKLVLNLDSPAQLSRMLAYYDHVNRAQLEKIRILKNLLGALEATYASIETELSGIKTVQMEQEAVLRQQQAQRKDREIVLAELAAKIDNEQAELIELERNREDLEILLQKLTDVLADIPASLGQHLGVAAQKGRLPLPIVGRVLHAYGQKRAAGVRWQGWVLEAAAGAEVRNIAYGRVAFSDWLRGYGLLMIIDHGQGFMSLYGYNESLLWDVGDWVEPGSVIATVGSNPGAEQGLYFELRKGGKAVDPAAWIKR